MALRRSNSVCPSSGGITRFAVPLSGSIIAAMRAVLCLPCVAGLAASARDDARAAELFLRLDQRGHVLAAVAECAGKRQRLMHGFTDDGRHREALGQVRVVA